MIKIQKWHLDDMELISCHLNMEIPYTSTLVLLLLLPAYEKVLLGITKVMNVKIIMVLLRKVSHIKL